MLHLCLRWLLLFGLAAALPVHAETSSSSIYSDVEQSVYQVRVINQQTGKKSAIGSGFVVSRADILATNYHVVSAYVNSRDGDFELDYLATNGNTGRLELLAVDVVHDLAILKALAPLGKPLSIGKVPPKGTRVYSLGNPMDKGFSIVEGTNNGEMQASDNKNILFSGSLNPGMSGGPALNEQKEVIGVNVATSGNGLSYLVPAQYLAVILERLALNNFQADEDIFQRISEQLLTNADAYIEHLNTLNWTPLQIGKFTVAGDIEGATRCWDNSSKPKPDDLVKISYTQCSNEHTIYLDDGVEVGRLDYEYIWLETDQMLPARFYRYYEGVNASSPNSDAGKDDVTNFMCFTDFVQISAQEFKLTVCRRDYLNYTGLSDLLITAALVGHKRQGFIFNLDMSGTTFEDGMSILKRMLEAFKWQA